MSTYPWGLLWFGLKAGRMDLNANEGAGLSLCSQWVCIKNGVMYFFLLIIFSKKNCAVGTDQIF